MCGRLTVVARFEIALARRQSKSLLVSVAIAASIAISPAFIKGVGLVSLLKMQDLVSRIEKSANSIGEPSNMRWAFSSPPPASMPSKECCFSLQDFISHGSWGQNSKFARSLAVVSVFV